jgi:hypothetical protein
MKLVKNMIQGAGYLEGYGEHPGTLLLLGFILMGGLAGARNGGLRGFLLGAAFVALFTVPVWLVGCVSRARAYQKNMVDKQP